MSFKDKVINFFKEIWSFLSTPYVYKNIGLMLGVFIIFFILIFYLILPGYTRHGEEVKIIEVKNLTVEQAKKTLNALRLKMVVADSTYIPDKTLGVIVDQSPAPGSIVKPNRTVYVTVNASQPPKVTIYYTQIITQHLDQVSRKLKSMDIKIGKLKYVPGKGENTIRSISMNGQLIFKEVDPRKGEKKPIEPQSIPRGSTIDLELYKGEDAEPKEVPDLLCSTYEEAKLLILGNEFNIGTVHIAASAKNDTLGAYIVKQSPRPGTEASMGTGIDIWIDHNRPEECD